MSVTGYLLRFGELAENRESTVVDGKTQQKYL